MIPINIDELLEGTLIESDRIEFKSDFNPEKIIRTICAFANDYDNIGGGYIVIGVTEVEGQPFAYNGLNPESIPKIEKELNDLCNKITPRYIPQLSHHIYKGAHLLVIWVPKGESRPYKCPVSLSSQKKSDNVERAYYIRRLSNTIRANRDEEIELIRRCNRITFDDSINEEASIKDMRASLVGDYLSAIGSGLDFANMDTLDLYRTLRIVRGPDEMVKPVNIGLMMFSPHPEDHFRGARIEVVYMRDETGTNMRESTFDGPIDDQLRKALSLIKEMYIQEMVVKVPYQAESLRFYNYPYEAVEEAVVNAVYHKDYTIPEPVRVYIYPDRMEISSCPGPDPSISDERIARFDLRTDWYRNGRLGDFLKELKLTEGRNTGIPKILRSLERNGSEMPRFETDLERRSLRVIIPVHESFLPDVPEDPIYNPKGKYRDPKETKEAILESLRINGCQSGRELATSIGYNSVNNTFRRCVAELMEAGLIEYKYPDSPKDRRQKICLARRGLTPRSGANGFIRDPLCEPHEQRGNRGQQVRLRRQGEGAFRSGDQDGHHLSPVRRIPRILGHGGSPGEDHVRDHHGPALCGGCAHPHRPQPHPRRGGHLRIRLPDRRHDRRGRHRRCG